MKVPDGFVEVRGVGAEGFARTEARAWVDEGLARWGSLERAARHATDALALEGRGPVYAVPAPAGGRWVVRRYLRGGWIAPLLGDRYLREAVPRPLREARASEAARSRGVPTPRVVAGVTYPSGLFYRADLVTEWVADSVDLATLLFERRSAPVAAPLLAEAASMVRRLAEVGIEHADLNAKNLLVRPGDSGSMCVLDLDRAAVRAPGSVDPSAMAARLARSLRKFERRTGTTLDDLAWNRFQQALKQEPT